MTHWRPGIFHGWLPVLRHPIRLRKWWGSMALSGYCWLFGHTPQTRPTLNMIAKCLTVSCKVCGMQLMGQALQGKKVPYASPGMEEAPKEDPLYP